MRSRAIGVVAAMLALAPACGSGGGTSTPAAGSDGGGAAALAGTVKDQAGVPVIGAKVEVGAASVFSDAQGKYTLPGLAPGMAALKVTRDWFQPLDEQVTVAATGATAHDITLHEMPLRIDPADRALAESYDKTFDWTKQMVSVAIVARPSRRDFDDAIYFHNPALYRDTSQTPPLTPSPLPDIAGGAATGFSFPVTSGDNKGQEALVLATVADSIQGTPLGPDQPADFMVWTSMINWLGEWDAARSASLKAAGLAVRQQGWGGNAVRPQDIQRVYLDAKGQLWAEVVFEKFVQLGPGVHDDDGDGRKEIYAQIAPAHYGPDLVAKLGEYGTTLFGTHGLSKELAKSLNELYSTTAAKVDSAIGQPFDLPGVGTFNYPFMVMRHSGGQKNVLLVAPAP